MNMGLQTIYFPVEIINSRAMVSFRIKRIMLVSIFSWLCMAIAIPLQSSGESLSLSRPAPEQEESLTGGVEQEGPSAGETIGDTTTVKERVAGPRGRRDRSVLQPVDENDRIARARREAEEKTRAARMETGLAISREQKALESVLAELAAYRSNLDFTRENLLLSGQEHRARLVVLRNRLTGTPAGSTDMDVLYDEMVSVMQDARKDMAESLDSYSAKHQAPRYTGDMSSLSPIDGEQKSSIERLRKLSGEASDAADEAEAVAADLSWLRLKSSIAWAEDVNVLRLEVLQKTSRAKRARILGITREGIAQLKREVTDKALS
jgi:hypothetical protein